MHQGDPRAVAPQVERRLGGAVAAAEDDHVLAVVGVGLQVAGAHPGEVLAGHVQFQGVDEVAGGERHGARFPHLAHPARLGLPGSGGGDGEPVPLLPHLEDVLIEGERDLVAVHHRAIVGQRLAAARLVLGDGERDVGDLQEVAGGEELHEGGIGLDRRGQRPAVHQQDAQPLAARLGADRDPGRPGPHHQQVQQLAHTSSPSRTAMAYR
jgi:hypothetical protein